MLQDDGDAPTDGGHTDDDDEFPDERAEDPSRRELEAMLLGTAVPQDPEPGSVVTGTVVQLGDEDLFLDIGAKSEALLARAELTDDDGELEVAVGDRVEASVASVRGGAIRLSLSMLRSARSRSDLEDAHAAGIPVQGRVEAVKKGGFDVSLAAGQHGFCPLSQIDDQRVEEPETWVGRTLEFLILELSERGRNIVVSRRRLLDQVNAARAEETRKKLAVGAVLDGTVASLQGYGAFIELGGIQGLVHVSELSHTRVSHPSEVLAVGDEVRVKVIGLGEDGKKISLSLKQLIEEPWTRVHEKLAVGQRLTGRVSHMAEFGAFVTLSPGIDGLIHVSELAPGKRTADARKLVEAGQELEVEIKQIDTERRRIALALVTPADAANDVAIVPGAVLEGTVSHIERFGVFVRLGPGRVGLVPNEEMGTGRGTDHRKDFPPGTPLTVEVLSIEDGGKRIRLSRSSAQAQRERAEVDRFLAERADTEPGAGFSTLGDALRDQLGRNKRS